MILFSSLGSPISWLLEQAPKKQNSTLQFFLDGARNCQKGCDKFSFGAFASTFPTIGGKRPASTFWRRGEFFFPHHLSCKEKHTHKKTTAILVGLSLKDAFLLNRLQLSAKARRYKYSVFITHTTVHFSGRSKLQH